MNLIKSKNSDVNYLSKIVNIKEFRSHQNPEVTRLKCCSVDGFNIIVGIDYEPGLYVYFPTLSCINSDFLSYANLFKHSELNRNPEQSGMFEDNGRVKAIRLKGELSEGFLIPFTILQNYIISVTNKTLEVEEGTEFDSLQDGEKTFWISKKYRIKTQVNKIHVPKSKVRQVKGLNKIREDQFRFHYDTVLVKKCPYVLQPDQLIHISSKWHGCSSISAYVLCHKKLTIWERIAKFLTGHSFDQYDYVYSSRSVIKNPYYNPKVSDGYYGCDIWGEADKIVRPKLSKGITCYYEIVGYLPTSSYIQKDYDYGCIPPKEGEPFTYDKHFKIRVYRVTYTNVDGEVHEFSTQEVRQWCDKVGLIPVEQFYYGYAKDLFPNLEVNEEWVTNFIDKLSNCNAFFMEKTSPDCNNKVPHEGIVIKIEDGKSRAFKLKCFKFISGVDMTDDSNIEDDQ